MRCEETVRIDSDRIVALYSQMGQHAAERLMSKAIEDLAVQMVAVDVAIREGRQEAFGRAIDTLIPLATQVGMSKLVRIAQDLRAAVAAQDAVARDALLARLVRIGDRSLSEVWGIQDMSL
ncbi:hypothetical protein BFP70_01010 [Thioclava sp. SK-1]|nr:hypothetical protein BFP70_01010 [Thioclava sp. SK-1]